VNAGLLSWKGALIAGAAASALFIGGMSHGQTSDMSAPAAPAVKPPAPPGIQAPPDNAPPAVRGQYLAVLGDCAACHTAPHGQPFAGGLPLETPFGTIYSTNITPDRETGIGAWTPEQFRRAMHEGKRADGANLYPAFPYPYFTHASAGDVEAIRAYLMTLTPVNMPPKANKLGFPFNIRFLLKTWNWLNFKPGEFQTVPTRSVEWNRGAYIVTSLGHCGACHTPKNILFGDKRDKALHGGEVDYWYAPNLTGTGKSGLKSWSVDDIATYLRTGMNDHAGASGSMQDVVEISTSKMSDADLHAIGVYLKSLPEAPEPMPSQPSQQAMRSGQAIYVDQCAACHAVDGSGAPGIFPPLRANPGVQQTQPTTAIHAILTGAQAASTASKPTSPSMPAFAWKLTDYEVAAVATYVRNSWGNSAEPVSERDVAKVRSHVAAHPVQRKKGAV
jgi:mono/diheme cytochrome c family protein